MFPGHLHDLLQHLFGIQGAGRVVGIDDDNALGLIRHLAPQILDIRIPVGGFIAYIVHGFAPRQSNGSGPQGIIRTGHQDLISVIQQRLHGHGDELAHPVARKDILDPHIGDMLQLAVLHDSLPGGKQALGIGIALAGPKVIDHIQNDLVRRKKPEGGWVADIELQDLRAPCLHPHRLVHHGSPDIVGHIVQFAGLVEFPFHDRFLQIKNRPEPKLRADINISVLPPEFGPKARTLPGTDIPAPG